MKHKHAELIKAWADGAEIEWQDFKGEWKITKCPHWFVNRCYRIKPEPKPDVVRYVTAEFAEFFDNYRVSNIFKERYERHNLKLTWDGETGALKSSEVLK